MIALKPSISLVHERNGAGAPTTKYGIFIAVEVEVTLQLLPGTPLPLVATYGSPKPGQSPSDPDVDTLVGTETLVTIPYVGVAPAGTPRRTDTYYVQLDKAQIRAHHDKRVRVYVGHTNHNHDGTSSAHYGDPK